MGRFDHLYVTVEAEVAAPVKVEQKAPARKKAASKKSSNKSPASDD